MKYTFSKRFVNKELQIDEIFGVTEAHSFDEAIKVIEKGIYDRKLQLSSSKLTEPKLPPLMVHGTIHHPPTTPTPNTSTLSVIPNQNEIGGNKTT